jgi:hypothetical protein
MNYRNKDRLKSTYFRFLIILTLCYWVIEKDSVNAATLTAASSSFSDVQAAVNSASNGSTVIIPVGTSTWGQSLTINGKAITIQGAGVGKTILIGGHSGTLFQVTAPSSGRVRITGVELNGNRIGAGIHFSGPIWAQFQVDNSKFFEMAGRAIHVEGLLSGLIYHNTFIDNFKMVDTYAGTTYMNTSWQTPLTLGTTQCVVTEDNTFTYNQWYPRSAAAVSSHGLGGRATWRYNTWQNNIPGLDFFPIIDAHGNQEAVNLETNSGNHRGTRQLELYNNTFRSNVGNGSTAAPGQIRGGTAVIFNNSYTGTDVGSSYEMREEDGPNRFNRLTTYPGYDQHWVWIWNNTSNTKVMGWHASLGSEAFVITGVNIFTSSKPDYTPLPYPHPWRSAAVASPIPPERSIDWSKSGVPGGIPNRTTIFATFNPGATAAQINTAIQNCPSNQVVFLNAGTYNLTAPLTFNRKNHVTLRGAGMGKTIIQRSGSGAVIDSGSTAAFGTIRQILGGNTKGSTSITVDTASGIQPGTILNIFQDADPSFYWTRQSTYRQDHTGQFVMVTGVSGNTLQLEDPLVWDFNVNPRLKPETLRGMRWSGIEDLTITADSSFGGEFIQLWKTYATWIKNVETAWGNGNSHIQLHSCLRSDVRDCYIHDTFSTSDGYGILTVAGWSGDRAGCTGLLIENNIFSGLRDGMILETEVGSVIAYNYFRDSTFSGWPNYQIADINANHGGHVMMNLFEGNVAVGFISDGYHGSSSHYTLFRNWISGQHVDSWRTGNVKLVDLCRFSRYSNVVGNVLGFSGWPRATTGRYEMTGIPGYTAQTCVYRLGYPNVGNNAYSLTNPPTNGDSGGLDPLTVSTLMRWGNFDYQNNATRWEASEIPSGVAVPSNHSLPLSLYRSAKPVWWGSLSWPAFGPDLNPMIGTIPAQLRYEELTSPPSDSDSDGLLDAWEILYFGSIAEPRAQPEVDGDGDGLDNLAEQSAGTSPVDSSDRLAIFDQRFVSSNSFQIHWSSISGKTYEVQVSTNMTGWTTITNVTATSTNATWTDATISGGKRFYRIKVP